MSEQAQQTFDEFRAYAEAEDPASAERAESAQIRAIASSESQYRSLREITIGNKTYTTSLPEGVHLFESSLQDARHVEMNPKDLDKLVVGEYRVYSALTEEPAGNTRIIRSVVLREGSKGKVVAPESIDGEQWSYMNNGKTLLELLGYEFSPDTEDLIGVPTPETLRKAAAEQGIDVEFCDEREIPASNYLNAFKRGKYPVSYGYYKHDIDDEHITGLLLGGEPMRRGLQKVASNALSEREAVQKRVTANIDAFTEIFRIAFSTGLDNSVGPHSTAREQIILSGRAAGLKEEEVEAMINTGIAKAEEFGLHVPGLQPKL